MYCKGEVMTTEEFESMLDKCCDILTSEALQKGFKSSKHFEDRVREVLDSLTVEDSSIYIERALKLIEDDMRKAAMEMDDAIFVEYWGESVPPEQRIKRWLQKADEYARDWKPSSSLFFDRN